MWDFNDISINIEAVLVGVALIPIGHRSISIITHLLDGEYRSKDRYLYFPSNK